MNWFDSRLKPIVRENVYMDRMEHYVYIMLLNRIKINLKTNESLHLLTQDFEERKLPRAEKAVKAKDKRARWTEEEINMEWSERNTLSWQTLPELCEPRERGDLSEGLLGARVTLKLDIYKCYTPSSLIRSNLPFFPPRCPVNGAR